MGMQFEYDESGEKFNYFLLAVFGILLAPFTYFQLMRLWKSKGVSQPRVECTCDACQEKRERLSRKTTSEIWRNPLINTVLLICWAIFAFLLYKAVTTERVTVEWNPYEVLGIDTGAGDADIKRAYRQLSMVHHPDRGGDEQTFVKITKAYKALTDAEARKNWEQYGNPDGPGVMTFGIALPSWIVDKKYSMWVLLVYMAIFMVGLPAVVGYWWYKSNKYSTPEILIDTQRLYLYFFSRAPTIPLKRILMILSGSFEFDKSNNPEMRERETDNVNLPELMKRLDEDAGQTTKDPPFCNVFSVKARVLMHAYLERTPMPSIETRDDMRNVIKKCPALVNNMINTLSSLYSLYGQRRLARPPALELYENVMRLSQLIVQALPVSTRSPLLQLPHFDEQRLRHFSTKKRNVKTVSQFLKLPDEERRPLLRDLNAAQIDEMMLCAERLPRLEVHVKLLVLDEEDQGITASSIVTAMVELKRWNLGDWIKSGKEGSGTGGVGEEDGGENTTKIDSLAALSSRSGANGNKKGGRGSNKPVIGGAPGRNNKNAKRRGGNGGKPDRNFNNSPQKTSRGATAAAAAANAADDSDEPPPLERPSKPGNEKSAVVENNDAETLSNSAEAGAGGDSTSKKSPKATKTINDDDDDSDADAGIPEELRPEREIVPESKSRESHPVHCPHFPLDKQEWWWLYIVDPKSRRLVYPPQLITDLVDDKKEKLQFLAPERSGHYCYTAIIRSDSYLGCDVVENVRFHVAEARKPVENHPQWDLSESEHEQEGESADEYATETDTEESDSE